LIPLILARSHPPSTSAPLNLFTSHNPTPTHIYTLSLHDALPISVFHSAAVPCSHSKLPAEFSDRERRRRGRSSSAENAHEAGYIPETVPADSPVENMDP